MVPAFFDDHHIFIKNAVIIQQSWDDILCEHVHFYPRKI
jgi:hypothetical protein